MRVLCLDKQLRRQPAFYMHVRTSCAAWLERILPFIHHCTFRDAGQDGSSYAASYTAGWWLQPVRTACAAWRRRVQPQSISTATALVIIQTPITTRGVAIAAAPAPVAAAAAAAAAAVAAAALVEAA